MSNENVSMASVISTFRSKMHNSSYKHMAKYINKAQKQRDESYACGANFKSKMFGN